ncbi:hypothetical protein HPPN120_06945 [Helicobacter pylori Puno120]|nr:hypothetical protein HPPN120_06945 [Helicobacter pylori Puno120]
MKNNTAGTTTTIITHTTTTIMAVNTTITTTTALIMKKVVAALAIVIIKKRVAATGITSNIGVARGNLTRVVSGFDFRIPSFKSNPLNPIKPPHDIQNIKTIFQSKNMQVAPHFLIILCLSFLKVIKKFNGFVSIE